MKKALLLLFLIALFTTSNAQRIRVMGRVLDSISQQPIKDVTVSAFSIKDTALLNFTFTTKNGNYYMEVNGQDSILVTYSYFAYVEQHHIWKYADRYYQQKQITLAPDPKWNTLSKVKLKTSPITMKGDTIEIIASRFKVLPGSDVAQLFKQIPGFEVDVSGTVKVNGKDINKIMVDGSDFFGNNPALVSKTLRADMIEKVQVYEEKDNNGKIVQDGEILINLKLKKGANNGFFGDAILGAGTQELFEAGLRINSFKEDRKLSLIANGNNTNNSGFDFGFNSWHGWINTRRQGQTWGDKAWENGTYTIPEQGNINNVADYGISYFNEIKPKVKVSGNVVYSNKLFDNTNFSLTENFINDSTTRSIENRNVSRGLKEQLSYQVAYSNHSDSMIWYELSFKGNRSEGLMRQQEENSIEINSTPVNQGEILALSEQRTSQNIFAAEAGGRLSKKRMRPYWGLEFTAGMDEEKTELHRFNLASTDSFNLLNSRAVDNQYILANASMYIPIAKNFSIDISSELFRQSNNFNGLGLNGNQIIASFEQPYVQVVDTLSTDMSNSVTSYSHNFDLSYYNDKVYVSAELTRVDAQINGSAELLSSNLLIDNSYGAWLPSFYFSYGRRTATSHSFYFNTQYGFPQGSDLLPAYNVFQIWDRSIGNPNLGLSITNGANYWIRKRFKKGLFKSLDGSVNYSWSDQFKANSTITNEEGLAEVRPVILEDYTSFNTRVSSFLRLYKKLVSLRLVANYNQVDAPLQFNNTTFLNSSTNYRGTIGINVDYSDSLSFSVSYNAFQLRNSNNRSESLDFEQFTQGLNTSLRAITPWGTQVNIIFNLDDQRAVPGIGKFIPLLNAYLQHPLDKRGKWSLKLTGFDLFNQNIGISRSVNQGFVSINQRNLLNQYFMLTAVYKVKNMGGETRKWVW